MRTRLHPRHSTTLLTRALTHSVGRCRRGTLLLEGLIAIGIFAIFLAGMGLALLGGEAATVKAGDYGRGAFLAEEQLEALRHLKDDDLGNLISGTYGVQQSGGTWSLVAAPVTRGGFQTQIELNALGDGWVGARSRVSWNFGKNRSGAVLLHTYFTDWHVQKSIGNWSSPILASQTTLAGSPNFHAVAMQGSYAFIAGDQAGGGPGLVIYNIANPALPIRVASSFNLGAGAYDLVIAGDRLFIATDNPSAEVQVYDITSPSTLALGNLVSTYDLPGSGRARAIAVYGDTVFVGAAESPSEAEFYALRTSETGNMTFLDSLDIEGSIAKISLHDGYAYLASTNNAGELTVVDTFDPADLSLAPDGGVDLTDVYDGTTVHASGTGVFIGRANGTSIEELTLYDIASNPSPQSPPGPWTLELGGSATAIDTIPGSAIGFIGSTSSAAEVRIIDTYRMVHGQSPLLTSINLDAATTALTYDWEHDRLLIVTAATLFLYKPS